jgi:hypothetical protein
MRHSWARSGSACWPSWRVGVERGESRGGRGASRDGPSEGEPRGVHSGRGVFIAAQLRGHFVATGRITHVHRYGPSAACHRSYGNTSHERSCCTPSPWRALQLPSCRAVINRGADSVGTCWRSQPAPMNDAGHSSAPKRSILHGGQMHRRTVDIALIHHGQFRHSQDDGKEDAESENMRSCHRRHELCAG